MAVISQGTLMESISAKRFDAEYFRPEFIAAAKALSVLPTTSLAQHFQIADGNHLSVSQHFSHSHEIPYYRGQDITDFFIENTEPMKIPQTLYDSTMMRRSYFRGEDVLLSIVGTIGSLCFVPETLGPATGSCKIAILRAKGSYSPRLLTAFLMSRFGQSQIRRHTRGAVQMGLILADLPKLLIPSFSEEEDEIISNWIDQALAANRQAKSAYTQAQRLLESALWLDKLEFAKPVGYTARFSELEESRRFDPEFFFPEFRHWQKSLPQRLELVRLGNLLQICQRGTQPRYATEGLPVVNSKHVQPNRVILEGNRIAIPTPGDIEIVHGDTLINGTGRGTLGRAAPYLEPTPALPDNHVTILRSSQIDPVFLSFFLNSRAGQMQVEMHQRGTSGQLELYPFDIRKLLVWNAPREFQIEVRRLHDQGKAAADKSESLLDQAKARVEQLIEEAVAKSGSSVRHSG